MNVQPLADRVAVRPHPDEETQKGGIIMLAGAQVRLPGRGEVVAVGPGRTTEDGRLVPLRVKVGDQVLFPRGQGVPCEVADQAAVLLFDTELYAIFEGEAKSAETSRILKGNHRD